jgi:hypothetical protein
LQSRARGAVQPAIRGSDQGKRKKLLWEIDRKLAPIFFYNRFAYCVQPQVKDWTMMVNSIINNWRMEDV